MISIETIGSFTLKQSGEEFKLTRDALRLTEFVPVHTGDRVCDLGCGVGNLLIPIAARGSSLTLDGVEIRDTAAALCRENLADNQLTGTIVTGSLTERYDALPWGRYDLVVANPPYFPAGSGFRSPSDAKGMARTEESYTLEAACAAARRLCRSGGSFCICIRPERTAELIYFMKTYKMEPKRMVLLQPSPDSAPNLTLIEARRDGRPGLQILPTLISR